MTVNWDKFDYKKEVKINLDELELDCQDQAELFIKYSREQARLGKAVAKAEENIKVVRSKLINQLLEDTKENSKKPTGVEMEAFYRTHPDHIEAKEQWIDLKYEYDLVSGCVSGMYSRRDMLQEEIKLLGMGYFSKVSLSQGNKRKIEIANETSDESRKKVNNRRRRANN